MRKIVCIILVLCIGMGMCACKKADPKSLTMADLQNVPSMASQPQPEPVADPEPEDEPSRDDFVMIATDSTKDNAADEQEEEVPEPTEEPEEREPEPTEEPMSIQMQEIGGGTPSTSSHAGSTPANASQVVGETAYNPHQDDKMREMAVEFGRMSLLEPPYNETYIESFRNAVWPKDRDFISVNAEVPEKMYEQPLNRWTDTPITASNSQFLNNYDTVAELGEFTARQIVEIAKRFAELDTVYDYTRDSKAGMERTLAEIFPPHMDMSQKAEEGYANIVARELQSEGFVTTDITQIYRDSDGAYRVRVGMYKHMLHATAETFAQLGYPAGSWINIDAEVVFGESDGAYVPLYYNKTTPAVIMDDSLGNRQILQQYGYDY